MNINKLIAESDRVGSLGRELVGPIMLHIENELRQKLKQSNFVFVELAEGESITSVCALISAHIFAKLLADLAQHYVKEEAHGTLISTFVNKFLDMVQFEFGELAAKPEADA